MKTVTTGILAAALVSSAAAQGTALYVPVKLIVDQAISLKGWGSGTISETDETAYLGTRSIRISSRNYFQGGTINFGKPVDLSDEFKDKANLLKIAFKAPDLATGGGGPGAGGPGIGKGGGGFPGGGPTGGGGKGGPGGLGGPGGPPGGPGGAGGGGQKGGGGFPGGQGGAGGLGGPGGPPGGFGGAGGQGSGLGSAISAPANLENLRLIVTTTDGKRSEAYIPVKSTFGADQNGWSTIAIPLQAITGFDRTNKIVKSIALAPDTVSTFYVGELRIVEDTTPIKGEVSPVSLNLGANQEVRLTAFGMGGASILKYSWDFDSSDGIQEDAVGQSVLRKFRKPGTYTITLTISDYFGLKAPYVTTIKAIVNG